MDPNKILTALIVIGLVVIVLFIVQRIREPYEQIMDQKIDKLKDRISVLFPDIKNMEIYSGKKSFTIDKKEIYLCLRDEHGEYYEDNMLVYVLLHELAHVHCHEIGHTDEFYRVFDDILLKAESAGVYTSKIPPIQNYCNHTKEEFRLTKK